MGSVSEADPFPGGKDGFPAATGVVVNRLLRDGALIEIDAIAVVD